MCSAVLWSVTLFTFYGFLASQESSANATVCKSGYHYPEFCPQPEDPPDHTKCCRHMFTPKCCREGTTPCYDREEHIHSEDPDPRIPAIWCPGDNDTADATGCSTSKWIGQEVQLSCFQPTVLIWVVSIVMALTFLAVVTFGIVLCIHYKKGRLVKTRAGYWTLTGENHQALNPQIPVES